MATKTIHTLSYKLLIDADQFTRGTVASRKEINHAKREMRSMLTPMEKMQVSLDRLGSLAQKDARFQDIYNKKLKQYQNELKKSTEATNRFAKLNLKAKMSLAGLSAVVGGFISGKVASSIDKQVQKIDKLGKASERLGVSTEFLTRLQFAAGQTSGLSNDQTAKAIEKMTRRISEAAAGGGEAVKVLQELGLNAKELADSGPERAMLKIADAMRDVTKEHDRLRMATKLFDDEQAALHTTLGLTNKALDGQFRKADMLGATVTALDASKMAKVNDAIDSATRSFDAFSREFAITFAKPLQQVLEELAESMSQLRSGQLGGRPEVNRNVTFGDTAAALTRTATDAMNDWRTVAQMFGEVVTSDGLPKHSIGDIASQFRFPLTNLFENYDRIRAKRMIDESNAQKAFDREKRRKELAAQAEAKQKAKEAAFGNMRPILMTIGDRIRKAESLMFDARSMTGKVGANLFSSMAKMGGPQTALEASSFSSGPLESIAAGSSEAFKFLNQTTAHKTVEVQIAKEQAKDTKRAANTLDRIAGFFDEAKERGGEVLGL